MTLAKPITPQNSPAYSKRWKAALASAEVSDLGAVESWPGILILAERLTHIATSRDDFRKQIVHRVLVIDKTGADGAVFSQIKLVWDYFSLKAVQYMDQIIKYHCRALEIPAVLDAHQELHHAHFPDLYYAATSFVKVNKMIGDNFQISETHLSRHTILIDK
ncbi:hypothetical protein PYW08_008832 [Mythimna loreyi]|uniref:Uncharacterized protein n=1 Tax=Mythimna loreyi TaxID=667449 RepID=A0ACC2QDJ4_9NEOP|nr:hypothetical protein PYW08_008832 [Mythimna loreyi]